MQPPPCEICGAELDPSRFGGQCPVCLLRVATLADALPQLEDYELLEPLGSGGGGRVYLARQLVTSDLVALKLIRSGEFATASQLERFRGDAIIARELSHPNVIRILDCSHLHDEEPFFTMELIEGGSLADPRWRQHFGTPAKAIELLIEVARAVHFLHRHSVLHRDLKPANILLRSNGEPIVSDFGAAKSLARGAATSTGAIIGTYEYMSPDQASGLQGSALSDVYALGAILYDLLTGQPPFVDDSVPNLLRRIVNEDPAPPSRLVAGIASDLETVCLCALSKESDKRYQSAAAFADDLQRVLRDEPIVARRAKLSERSWRWARRHPIGAAAVAAGVSLLLFIAATATTVAGMQEQELRRSALGTIEYAASAQATAVLYQLREYANTLEAGARDPNVRALARRAAPKLEAPELEPHARGFGSLLVVAPDGAKWARWPTPAPAWFDIPPPPHRDYGDGARRMALRGEQKAYVARSFRSSVDHNSVFALSTPIFDARSPIGILVATIPADSALGASQIWRPTSSKLLTALVGPDESALANGTNSAGAAKFTFLVHPALKRGQHQSLSPRFAALLEAAFGASMHPDAQFTPNHTRPLARNDYDDPMLGHRWLAAFAPVGGTGFVVLVQSREAEVLEPARQLMHRFLYGFLVSFAGALALFSFFAVRRGSTRVPARREPVTGPRGSFIDR